MIVAWVEFIFILTSAFLCENLLSSQPIDTIIVFNPYDWYLVLFEWILIFANIALAIVQSVIAKKIGKVAPNIGFEQVICILTILIGFAFIFGYIATRCASYIPSAIGGVLPDLPGWMTNPASDTHWLLYIEIFCLGFEAAILAGFGAYNSILCAKVKVFKPKSE